MIVVGAAIVRDGRVLAAHRVLGSPGSPGWEFPGGKVEAGESDAAALVRECREELGADIVVGERLGEQPIRPGVVLRVHAATLTGASPEPQPLTDHDLLSWLPAEELDGLAWLPPDRPFCAAVALLLTQGWEGSPGRA